VGSGQWAEEEIFHLSFHIFHFSLPDNQMFDEKHQYDLFD